MYSITRACARGDLIHCGCDTKVRRKTPNGDFEWGGCSDNARYGAKFAKAFVDADERKVTKHGQVNLWNNEAGRRVSQANLLKNAHAFF